MTDEKNSTLETPRVRDLLVRLFAESELSDAKLREMFGALPPEERARRMSDPNADYRGFYGRAKELYLAVSPETARLLYLLGRATGARAIVEFGTSFGISTIHLAAALRDNGGRRLVGSEPPSANKVARRAKGLEAAARPRRPRRRARGRRARPRGATRRRRSDRSPRLDGHKPLYPKILDLVAPRLRAGACIVADNVEASPAYVARVRAPGGGYVSVPFAAGVELSMKL